MKLLHIAHGQVYNSRMLTPLMLDELEKFGDLTILLRGSTMTEEEKAAHIRQCDVLLTGWGGTMTPECIAEDPGSLKYILNITGEMRNFVGACHIAAGIPVTNWGDAPAPGVAEGAMALLFAVMKNIRPTAKYVEAGHWGTGNLPHTSLNRLRVGIYGMGVIAQEFIRYIAPFGSILSGYDPYVPDSVWPESVRRVDSLESLVGDIDALVIHAGLSPETRHSINAKLLAKLPDNGIVINTARGGIVDQPALMAELQKGRLRAGLDVLDSEDAGDMLLVNDPARHYPNLILTCHNIENGIWPERVELSRFQQIALDNLRRFASKEPLRFTMDLVRYGRST